MVVNGISSEHQAYLAAGGTGILVGDGQLPHPGLETILETYYSLLLVKGLHLTAFLYAVFIVMAALGLLAWRRGTRDTAMVLR